MGSVYLAEHNHIAGRKVAIKVMANPDGNERDLARFRREAETLVGLDHPNIVRALDFGLHEDGETECPYLIMEYLSGGDLEELLVEEGPLDCEAALGIIVPLLQGLGAAHEKGLIHRDLKPGNIVFDTERRPRLADFGLVHVGQDATGIANSFSGQLTEEGFTVGTPNYMSPEQQRGEPLEASSDIYSLGLVFFRSVTGRLPTLQELPSEVVSSLPRAADEIYLACVGAKSTRPKDAKALEALIATKSPFGAPATPVASTPTSLESAGARPADALTERATDPTREGFGFLKWALLLFTGAVLGAIPGVLLGWVVFAATGSKRLVSMGIATAVIGVMAAAVFPLVVRTALGRLHDGSASRGRGRGKQREKRLPPPSGQSAVPGNVGLFSCRRCSLPVIQHMQKCPACGEPIAG